ncbi:MAG: mechanosensitive ion channel family protein [candidate division WOR-3 bacterium]|nr:mechanosensitive ion channel family protein [candidate division WOR-3 bacterium]
MKALIIKYIVPIIIVCGSVVLGLICQIIIFGWLKSLAKKTRWRGDEVIIHSLQGWIILWFLIAGLSVALPRIITEAQVLFIINKILFVAAIFSITAVIANIAVGFVDMSSTAIKEAIPRTTILTNITRVFILLIGILIILHSLGISIAPILAGLGIGGLAVALALQDTLSNLFAGLQIIISKQVRPGDYVKLATGEDGYVEDVTWRNTTIREFSNNLIIIPNSKLAQTIVKNYHLPEKGMAVIIQVGVSYDSDLEKVEKIVLEVARETLREVPGGVKNFEPLVRYHTFGEFSVQFSVILQVEEFASQFIIKHEFIKRLHRRFKAENIKIPYPIRTIHLEDKRNGNE